MRLTVLLKRRVPRIAFISLLGLIVNPAAAGRVPYSTQRNVQTSWLSNFYLKQKHTWKGNKFGGFRVSANRFDLHRGVCVCVHMCLVWRCSLNPESSVGSIDRQIDDLFRVSIDSRRKPRFDCHSIITVDSRECVKIPFRWNFFYKWNGEKFRLINKVGATVSQSVVEDINWP